MKKRTVRFALLVLPFFFYHALFAETIPLSAALSKGLLKLSASAAGGNEGKCLRVTLENRQQKSLGILIPAGRLFEAADTNEQDLMVVKDEVLLVESGKSSAAYLHAFCIEATDRSPSQGSRFGSGREATGHLLKLAQYLNDNRLYENPCAQYAVWAVSDDERLESIGDQGLATFVADLLGKPLPEYHIAYQQPEDRQLPGRPANWREAVAVDGLFYYELPKDQHVSVGLYSESGEHLHTLFSNRLQKKGYQ